MSVADIISYILHKADYVIETLQSVFNYLLSAKNIGIGPLTLPPDLLGTIQFTQNNINAVADNLHKVTGASSEDISNLLTPLRIPLIHVTAFMLALVIFGFFLSLGGMQCLVYFLLVVGWIAVTFVFVASGLFLLVHNAVEDTCVAMDDWLLNPNAHSALESIIPKADNQTARTILMDTKQITFALVNETNTVTNVFNADMQPSAGPLFFNQTGPHVPVLCMPLNANLTEVPCLTGEVNFTNASEVWKGYVCEVSTTGICITPGRITPEAYTELISSLNVSYALYEYGSFLVDLVDSTYVKETFMDISNNFCPSLRHSTKMMCVGFIMVAAASMLSLISWMSYGRERRCRKYAMKRMNQFPPPPPLPPQ
ncbi:uncharacterized protein LOC124943109 [Impatiens glandulifera]|uniref:uncharacterized protein LOC124943109 n=1 Tax=Impatiens glandulifera TaxID=253017 RepID=UPI001FB13B7D|nr:uncharacterized protein LOC124943109 [Impatiens glandulifera]